MASVKWSELFRWSLVEVEFGTQKKYIECDLGCVDVRNRYYHGINADNEFSSRHMAIVISKHIRNNTVTVLPLTEASQDDKRNTNVLILEQKDYRYFLHKDTKVLTDHPLTIDKKARIKKIKMQYIPLPLRRKIVRKLYENFKMK